MADGQKGKLHHVSDGGLVGEHPDPDPLQFPVGPATSTELNTAHLRLIPIACVRLDNPSFLFDSSFVLPRAKVEMRAFADFRKSDPRFDGAPISIFGHADPSYEGNFEFPTKSLHEKNKQEEGDAYNKILSGRRAIAIYAMLIRDTGPWETLFNGDSRVPGDKWGDEALDTMRATTGLSASTPRSALFRAYMDALCSDLKLVPEKDFLARNAGSDHKGDVQGCSRFNPLLLFSSKDEARFKQAFADKNETILRGERDLRNAINRSAMILIFKKGSQILPAKWPCPTFKEGPAGCKERFFSDGDTRRSSHDSGAERKFELTHDTFACRFYQRISGEKSPCHAILPPLPPPLIEIILDHDNDHVVDENEPVAEFVRIGLWDKAYDASGNVKNNAPEAENFVGADFRRFYFRVTDASAASRSVNIKWKSLKVDKTDDDAPGSQVLTLQETRQGSKVFVSKAIMLVTDDTDLKQPTNSGLSAPLPDVGVRNQGQSNHRLRRARIDGFVKGEYQSTRSALVTVERPVFKRNPDERRRVSVRVINYGGSATANYISGQLEHANQHWNRVGIQIDPQPTVNRPTAAGVLNAAGFYTGSLDNAAEQAALHDLIPATPDGTLTAVFVPLTGANAYATVGQRTQSALQDRFFIFINTTLALTDETLAHELHHVLFNRFDTDVDRQFFPFNTNPPGSFGIPLPDVRIYGRVQNLNSADPDNDATNNNIINWARRTRTARFPIAPGTSAATATTGNKFATQF